MKCMRLPPVLLALVLCSAAYSSDFGSLAVTMVGFPLILASVVILLVSFSFPHAGVVTSGILAFVHLLYVLWAMSLGDLEDVHPLIIPSSALTIVTIVVSAKRCNQSIEDIDDGDENQEHTDCPDNPRADHDASQP